MDTFVLLFFLGGGAGITCTNRLFQFIATSDLVEGQCSD